ncbi:hypothetical protein [Paenibacillus naphthalenovorans]|uniref:hypothetical protein n=1 Tax=Paenibacillus naphthalenovorans TaxID=162209 RepID=UPI0010F54F04|nr:hypothetical protein [Paenibacillus naphthalenovorans]
MGRKYEKYIMCNFGYFDERREVGQQFVSLIYTHADRGMGQYCDRCGERLTGKLAHYFTEVSEGQEAWIFGSTCVGYVFGAGLSK